MHRSTEIKTSNMMELLSNLWLVFIKPFVHVYEYYKRQILINNSAHQVKLEEFIPWFENQLLTKSSVDIQHVNSLVQELDQLVVRLNAAVSDSRSTISATTPQTNRLLRVCDQIDLFCAEYDVLKHSSQHHQYVVVYPFDSLLPDAEHLRDLVGKIKSKLKIIDDVTQSKKSNGDNIARVVKSGSRTTEKSSKKAFDMPSALKSELTRFAELMGDLELESVSQSRLMNYFGELKHHIHKPLRHLVATTAELPNIQDTSSLLTSDVETHASCCTVYDSARSAEVLQKAVLLRDELHEIERLVADILSPLRKAITGPHSTGLQDALCMAHGNTLLLVDVCVLGERLIKHMKCTNADLIRTTCDEYEHSCSRLGRENLVASVTRAQCLLEADRLNWEFDEGVQGSVEAVLRFDAPLFEAYCLDWGQRFMFINELLKSETFTAAYKQLCSTRLGVVQARRQSERSLLAHNSALDRHRDCVVQRELLQKKLVDLALTELYEDVVFVT